MRLTVNVDGGARGNPGPCDRRRLPRRGRRGDPRGQRDDRRTTNNVAEYRALLLGLERAQQLSATEVDVIGDSELVVKQVRGEYRVKDAGLRPLHSAAQHALGEFSEWTLNHVKREFNSAADALVNQALDADV
ncbi:MAG: ribonuclease HI family protein [Solirubrobacterales bacterium]